jgi:hypothetical protein
VGDRGETMTNPNDNAFPMVVNEASSEAHNGMTKREFFAVLIYACDPQRCAFDDAVECADKLIKELNK